MNAKTFKAIVEVLDARWPWPEAGEAARREFHARLWARVESWRGDYTKQFRSVVEGLVGTTKRYNAGRPGVDEITSQVYKRLGGKSAVQVDENKEAKRARYADLRAWIREGWICLDSSFDWVESYATGITLDELKEFWPMLVKKKICPGCEAVQSLRLASHLKTVWYYCPRCKETHPAPSEEFYPGVQWDNPDQMTEAEQEKHDRLTNSKHAKMILSSLHKIGRMPF